MERSTDKGVNSCHLCGSEELEPNPKPLDDPRQQMVCRSCGAAVNITHWVVYRSQWWPEVTYVTQESNPQGQVLAFSMPTRYPGRQDPLLVFMVNSMFAWDRLSRSGGRGRAGMTPLEATFIRFKLQYPDNDGPQRYGRVYITPRVIKDEPELKQVQAQVDDLLGRKRDETEDQYLNYLAELIIAWEEELMSAEEES